MPGGHEFSRAGEKEEKRKGPSRRSIVLPAKGSSLGPHPLLSSSKEGRETKTFLLSLCRMRGKKNSAACTILSREKRGGHVIRHPSPIVHTILVKRPLISLRGGRGKGEDGVMADPPSSRLPGRKRGWRSVLPHMNVMADGKSTRRQVDDLHCLLNFYFCLPRHVVGRQGGGRKKGVYCAGAPFHSPSSTTLGPCLRERRLCARPVYL